MDKYEKAMEILNAWMEFDAQTCAKLTRDGFGNTETAEFYRARRDILKSVIHAIEKATND